MTLDLKAIREAAENVRDCLSDPKCSALAKQEAYDALHADLDHNTIIALLDLLEEAREGFAWSLEWLREAHTNCGFGGVDINEIKEKRAILAKIDAIGEKE